MSKIVSKSTLAASIVLAMALTFSCSEAQAVDNEKRIIGTWAQVKADGSDGGKWVFNSDGTATVKGTKEKYAVAAGKLGFPDGPNGRVLVYDLSISTDGKTAILESDYGNYILRKKN